MSHKIISRRERGFALFFSAILLVVLMGLGSALIIGSIADARSAELHRAQIRAMAVAESGLERAIMELKRSHALTGQWDPVEINGLRLQSDTQTFYPLPLAGTQIDTGTYSVEIRNVAGRDDTLWVRSTGAADGANAAVLACLHVEEISIWQNAIFAGTGQSGKIINGNVALAGSVHILGQGLAPTDVALALSGGATVQNNYANMSAGIRQAARPLPTGEFNGETVELLEAKVRVRQGRVDLSGTGALGSPDATGNAVKETLDGVYVTDGFGGNQGSVNVYSDNGHAEPYDLGASLAMPKLSDPYDISPSYLEHLRRNALVITAQSYLQNFSSLSSSRSFAYTDPMGKGSISMDGNGNLHVEGIIYIDGNLHIGGKGSGPITYTGKGSFVVAGQTLIDVNLLPGGMHSFPGTNLLAIMTANDVTFDTSQLEVAGLFYAENKIVATKQANILGAFASNYFDMGSQVPSVFYSPLGRHEMPPGLIGATLGNIVTTRFWQKVDPQ